MLTTIIIINALAIAATIINAIDERRHNAAKRRPALRLNAKLRRRVSNRPSKRLAALAAAGLVTSREQATSVSQRRQQAARTYRNIIATAKHTVKRFNGPKIKRSITNHTTTATTTINRQPIASPAARDKAMRYARLITEARTSADVYRNWVESTDDMGFNIEVYDAYKARKAALIAA